VVINSMSMRKRLALALFLGLALIASSCGGDGNESGGGTASKRAIETEAQERAEAIVLKLADFPDGWRASAPEDEGGGDDFRNCIGLDYSALTVTGEAESDDFAMGEATEVQSEALVYASDAEAETALDEFSDGLGSTAVEDCVKDLYEDALEGEEDVKVGEIDVGELSFTPPPDLDEASAWQVAVPLEGPSNLGAGEVSITVYLDLIHLREGDTLVYVSTQDTVTPFDSDLRDDLLEAVASRMSE
jgi:hypothetical protein